MDWSDGTSCYNYNGACNYPYGQGQAPGYNGQFLTPANNLNYAGDCRFSEYENACEGPQGGFPMGYDQPSYAPCEGPKPWNFNYCYGYFGEPPCPFSNIIDMEDFM